MESRYGSETGAVDAYVDTLIEVIGHADRAEPLRDYCTGLMMPVARKSVKPLAAVTAPSRVSAKRQSLLHFVGQAPWSDDALPGRVRDWALPRMIERGGPVTAWIVDDTGFSKTGKQSAGVARQYRGQLGKQDNCQVVVSLSIATESAGLPVAWRRYLPEARTDDPGRRRKAKLPDEIVFQTRPQIAIDQIRTHIRTALSTQMPVGVVLAGSGYGADGGFRRGLTDPGLACSVGVQPILSAWRPGDGPLPPGTWSGKGRPPRLVQRSHDHRPLSARARAESLPADAWHGVTWREGSNIDLTSRFSALRLRVASRDDTLRQPRAEEWFPVEWPDGDEQPLRYWLSTMPETTPLRDLVATTKMRRRIERDYRELKQELGPGHHKGRGWRGFHHHASLCMAAYGLLLSEREDDSPPQDVPSPKSARNLSFPVIHDPDRPPIRPERHAPDCIVNIRRSLVVALVRRLTRCPCCAQRHPHMRTL